MNPDLAPYREALIPAYIDYCRTVSPRWMAMSLESVTYLWWLCDQNRAARVCDLGSGFTSYTLRVYAANADWPVTVVSVDDSPEWLEQTRRFLTRHGLNDDGLVDDGLVDWDVWRGASDLYDVIVHDLAAGELRNASMWVAAGVLAPGGFILFDDAQNNFHSDSMWAVCQAAGMRLADIRAFTTDAVNRFSLLAVPA